MAEWLQSPNDPALRKMTQEAPYPFELEELVETMHYRPGWMFRLLSLQRDDGCCGLTFEVYADVHDSYHPEHHRPVLHYFIVPAATYDKRAWTRWILDQLIAVETHEACEYLCFGESAERPFAPTHGPGKNPYSIKELATAKERGTRFDADREEEGF